MKNTILSLTKKFIAIQSTAENTKALDEILNLALSHLEEFTIERFQKNGSVSALVYNTKKRPKKFKIILNGHLDVIPGKKILFKPKIVGKKLYGIGAMDMKANAACLIMAFKEVAKKVAYPIALQLVTDEQTGGINGTKYQIEKGVKADFIIAGETTNFHIVHKAKGVLWIKISCTGKSAHSAYPWQGKNAVLKMITFLNKLKKKYPTPGKQIWKTTINVSRIETTNTAFNKIPDTCSVFLDIRYIPEGEHTILNTIKALLPNGFTLDVVFHQDPLLVDKNNTYIKTLKTTTQNILKQKITLYSAHGTSDVTYYASIGCAGVEFGPIGMTGNTHNEYIAIPSLEKYYHILTTFLLKLD